MTATTEALSEVDAIAALADHLPTAGVDELLRIGADCPDPRAAALADQLAATAAELRGLLTALAGQAHAGAAAAEAWIASLEVLAAAESATASAA